MDKYNTMVHISFNSNFHVSFNMILPEGFSDEDVVEHAEVSYDDTIGIPLSESKQSYLMTIVYLEKVFTYRGKPVGVEW